MEPDKVRLVQSKYEGSAAKQIFAVLIACTGAFSFGYTIGFSSPGIPSMIKAQVITEVDAGFFGSLLPVGAIFGGPVGGWCVEKLGRKRTILLTSLPFMCGWLTIAYHQALMHMFIGRLLTGFASGMITVCVPVYNAEVSSKTYRGKLGSFTQLFITIGILAVYLIGATLDWKNLALVGIIPAALTAFGCLYLPESPHWLLSRGQKAEAINALKLLRDNHMDVGEECRDIEESIDVQEKVPCSEFMKPEILKPLMIILFVMVFQQFSGINAIMFYSVTIFEMQFPEAAHEASIAVGVVQVFGTLTASMFMDKSGRRKLLVISGAIMSSCLFMLGYLFSLSTTSSPIYKWMALISVMLYVIGFGLGWGPIPILVMSELLPARVRGGASAVAILTNWSCAFVVTMTFIPFKDLIGDEMVFFLFGASCILSVCFVLRFLPETKGKSLEDIELFFLGKGAGPSVV
ncbi:hypothetical protein LOTGIDRAFT_170198 [Lottia gigantea]|uniref:Major facilitator superfamily (MFS) profile domain-containing protein n=1 Tax=Lottia gigantea TaxID=225164 RepID=V4B1X1_LOTGI|nr:hypothetical protein LOTGIDRAFT_170198 [Lottia gigantea]ESO82279.1 hypothetical protein LOTGIDRAFT_170198 [Lottia gigantea]